MCKTEDIIPLNPQMVRHVATMSSIGHVMDCLDAHHPEATRVVRLALARFFNESCTYIGGDALRRQRAPSQWATTLREDYELWLRALNSLPNLSAVVLINPILPKVVAEWQKMIEESNQQVRERLTLVEQLDALCKTFGEGEEALPIYKLLGTNQLHITLEPYFRTGEPSIGTFRRQADEWVMALVTMALEDPEGLYDAIVENTKFWHPGH